MKKIVITTTSFGKYDQKPLRLLEKNGFEVVLNPYGKKLKKEQVIELCRDAVGVVAGTETLDADVIEKLTNLMVISRCGSGVDNIDRDVANEKGIKVFNTPEAPRLAVAELTVGLILNLLRKVNQAHIAIINGKWEKEIGNLLYGIRVGIIGFGRIGRKVAELLKPFNCELAYADPAVEDGLMGARHLSLEELLSWADIVSLHVSGKDRILGEKELRLMKKKAWLINTSRSGVVDEDALFRTLKEDHLAGCALDVFDQEPYFGPLRELDNVLLTPHIGSYAKETRIQMEREAVENLLRGLEE